MPAFRTALAALSLSSLLLPASAAQAAPPSLAFFGFHLLNTSPTPVKPEETSRIALLDGVFADLAGKSPLYRLVPVAQTAMDAMAQTSGPGHCNGCEADAGKRMGVDRVGWGEVQKVSELILNINIYIEDTATGKLTFVHSVDIRDNTDVSWKRGTVYLLKNYLLKQ